MSLRTLSRSVAPLLFLSIVSLNCPAENNPAGVLSSEKLSIQDKRISLGKPQRMPLPVIRPHTVPIAPPVTTNQSPLTGGGPDLCEAGSVAIVCAANTVASGSGLADIITDFGMFSVVGAGIRLPDEQLESELGLEDEW